jgi:LPS export ABC transporter protein LptC
MQMPNTRRIRQILAATIVLASVSLAAVIVVRHVRSTPPGSASKPISPEIDMSLTKLTFSEMRGNEKLWDLTAERADYDKETKAARLAGVKVDIFDGMAGGIVITSASGSYLEAQHLVTLQKNVHVVTRKGMVFDTDQLEYRSGPGVILADHPVKVADGRLTLTAQRMEMTLKDEKVLFRGAVDAVIEGYHAKR